MLQSVSETTARSRTSSWQEQPQAAGAMGAEPRPMDLLAAHGTKCTVKRGQEIYAESAEGAFCYKLVSGSVRLVKLMSDGRRQICEFLLPGDLLSFDIQDEHYFSAEAVSDCVLVRY